MKSNFSSEYYPHQRLATPAGGNGEKFADVPALFYQHLPPEQYQAMQQFYRAAYEQARGASQPAIARDRQARF
jgi:hypothetical protein